MNTEQFKELKELGWTNKADILKYFSSIHSDINKDVENDFVLGKPDEKEKKYIIRMAGLSDFARNMYIRIAENTKALATNPNLSLAEKQRLMYEANLIEEVIADEIYKRHMLKSRMLVIMARNNESNFLLKVAGDVKIEQQQPEETPMNESNRMQQLLEKIKPNEDGRN